MNSITKLVIILSFISSAGGAVAAQERPQPSPQPLASPRPTPAPETTAAISATNPADVASMDAIIAALYDVISGPAGKKRDWDRMRSLFIPGAHLIPSGPRQTGGYGARVGTVEDYITRSAPISNHKVFLRLKPRARQMLSATSLTSSAPTIHDIKQTTPNPLLAASTVFNC